MTLTDRLDSCLDPLRAVWPFLYAQWVIDDPETRDYRVVCSRAPDLTSSYAVAHRTGVIGQVFRSGRSIVVKDGHQHPLYDVFDPMIDWEIAIPCRDEQTLGAVLNLEGGGRVDLDDHTWQSMIEIVTDTTALQPPASPPGGDEVVLVDSKVITLSATTVSADALELARAVAAGGKSVVVVGDVNAGLTVPRPTLQEIELKGRTLADYVYGVAERLDAVRTGSEAEEWWTFERMKGLELLKGRYEFVMLCPSKTGTRLEFR